MPKGRAMAFPARARTTLDLTLNAFNIGARGPLDAPVPGRRAADRAPVTRSDPQAQGVYVNAVGASACPPGVTTVTGAPPEPAGAARGRRPDGVPVRPEGPVSAVVGANP